MKQTLLITLFSLAITSFVIASTDTIADTITDKMAVVGSPGLSSDPCAAIDKKVLKLDRFTEVVQNTSAFHLEEKANAISTPGITVSTNRKKMLKDAQKKYAEYEAERKKYGCKTPVSTNNTPDKMAILDDCTAIEEKVIRLDRFTEVVQNTSAFHLEEKASAIPTPGITVSNNRKKMLKDAEKKYVEYEEERKKHGCKTPVISRIDHTADTMTVTSRATVTAGASAVAVKEPVRSVESTTKVNTKSVEEKAAAVPVRQETSSSTREQTVIAVEPKEAEVPAASQTQSVEAAATVSTVQMDEKSSVSEEAVYSTEKCDALDVELIELSEFTSMVKNTSAFHLEEKASALPSPGFTVSNNKKKMLRDIEKRLTELLAERQKYGCEPLSSN